MQGDRPATIPATKPMTISSTTWYPSVLTAEKRGRPAEVKAPGHLISVQVTDAGTGSVDRQPRGGSDVVDEPIAGEANAVGQGVSGDTAVVHEV